MKAFRGSKAEVEKLAAETDRILGYPKPGVNVGGGVHAPPELGVTTKHAEIRENRKTREWVMLADQDAETVADGLKAALVADVVKEDIVTKDLRDDG